LFALSGVGVRRQTLLVALVISLTLDLASPL